MASKQQNGSTDNDKPNSTTTTTMTSVGNNKTASNNNKRMANLTDASATTPMSNSALEQRYKQLQEESKSVSQILTQKLASSQSGQNLLHMGSSLSTLPPDLHSLLQNLHPVLSQTESTEKSKLHDAKHLVKLQHDIKYQLHRSTNSHNAAYSYQDLVLSEHTVKRIVHFGRNKQQSQYNNNYGSRIIDGTTGQQDNAADNSDEEGGGDFGEEEQQQETELDHAAALERAAHVTLLLMEELHTANTSLTALMTTPTNKNKQDNNEATRKNDDDDDDVDKDTEHEEFLVKLAPRIRRLESDATQCLTQRMEAVLSQITMMSNKQNDDVDDDSDADDKHHRNNNPTTTTLAREEGETELLVLGHCMRGLAYLGRSRDVEGIFARVAIMPLVRSKVSMGKLDEGGSRGECTGLRQLLNDMLTEIANLYGPILRLSESMFAIQQQHVNNDNNNEDTNDAAGTGMGKMVMDIDLLTAGVWVPIATALMADAGIKMAIFSPGIASILQTNYLALDQFLGCLATRLLSPSSSSPSTSEDGDGGGTTTMITPERIQQAQDRVYAHPKTAGFSKKWNLPIYYQLRFGDSCSRLNVAVEDTKRQGWIADVFTGTEEQGMLLRQEIGFELSLFLELYDILLGLWRPDVILRPLTNRFLRGSAQLVGRVVSFISEGMDGKIMFGEEPQPIREVDSNGDSEASENGSDKSPAVPPPPSYPTRKPYCWGESEEDVAAVAWELTILDSTLRHTYVDVVCDALFGDSESSETDREGLRSLVVDLLTETSEQIHPIIDKAWNEVVVKLLTQKCSAPLAAVKGVAATYRMTNRPPPTQASPFVATVLRSLKEFDSEFANRTPERIGAKWKQQIIATVADRYAAAVDDLIATVQRTEVALKNRKARRTAAGGMSDGEKVKLQLYLDYISFSTSIREVGIEPATIAGVSKLAELTAEGEKLLKRNENGA